MNQNQTETNGRIEFLFSYLCHNVYHNLGLSKQQPIAFLMKTSAFVPSVDMREHVLFHKGVYELEIGSHLAMLNLMNTQPRLLFQSLVLSLVANVSKH